MKGGVKGKDAKWGYRNVFLFMVMGVVFGKENWGHCKQTVSSVLPLAFSS